ncbi:helix-turn-helix domain-containing protein [Butyrivibrio sp. YAB3001]|uniref:helix-turn-helix domain-containing protein n=1 Tax=Butyrivibrio sp. YAB3001 TaxID=1520812 RepID=UPI0008F66D53|nr:helix-turn-helix transcriptional regulator [Butyrivibrio sp. YAB3001]SFB82536.1 DNA-binding transcriptional regulator, XRE-family HTH domain [Butyrivibrio sp. YAB3001]
MGIEIDYISIGKRIRYYRKLKGMSQESLAEKVDISITHMSHIETASTKLSLPVFIALAQILEVSTDQLLRDTESIHEYCKDIENIMASSSLLEQKVMYNAVQSIKKSFNEP